MAKHIQMPPIYPIPQNWTWVELRQLTKIISGYPFDSKLFSDLNTTGRPLIRIRDVVRGYTETYTTEDCPNQYIIHKNDILIGMDGDFNVGKWQNEDALLNQRVCLIQSVSDLLLNDYLFYFLPKPLKQINDVTPSVTVKHLSTKTVESIMIPLPPLEEQQRLIVLIESLFAKLDESKEKAKEVVDGFETRKSAILHKAFSGELTEKWREENHRSLNEWANWSIDELCFSLKYGTAKKSKSEGSVVVIRMGNLQQGEIDWNDLAYSDDADDIEKYKLYPGDILFNRTNSAALVGKTSIYRGEFPAIFAGYLIKLDYDRSIIIGDYLNYALNTTNAKVYCNSVKTDGVNQSNINAKKIGAFSIPVAPIDEQEEIVRITKELLNKERSAKECAEAVIEQIDAIKKAILARAFRGELGTNDPNEESAVELLKKIL